MHKVFMLGAAIVAMTTGLEADEMSVNLVNRSDYAVCETRIVSHDGKLSAELLGAPCLERGESRLVTFDPGDDCVIDWQFVLKDYPENPGNPVERLTFDACTHGEYVLDD